MSRALTALELIAADDVLRNFPADGLQRRLNGYVDKLTADFAFGKVGVLQEITKATPMAPVGRWRRGTVRRSTEPCGRRARTLRAPSPASPATARR